MRILDTTCSAKSIWFDKNNSCVIRCDIRNEDITGLAGDGRNWNICPHVQMDYTAMSFPADTFDMIVFDPPHLINLGLTSWMAKKYGKLFANWRDNIRGGFDECWRVLKPEGTLIFKWNERDIKLKEVLELAPPPLFGHTTGSNAQTKWITFIKFSQENEWQLK